MKYVRSNLRWIEEDIRTFGENSVRKELRKLPIDNHFIEWFIGLCFVFFDVISFRNN